jgi:granule-bound starch synthase
MTISPRYDQYEGAWDTAVTVNVMGHDCRYFHERKKDVDRVFVDNPLFLAKVWGKTGSKLYGAKSGADFKDNQTRFAVFCHAAVAALKALPFGPGEDCVMVANDWHSALVPVIVKTVCQPRGENLSTKVALCVHNIAFQGRFWPTPMSALGLPEEAATAFAFEDGVGKVFTEDTPAVEEGEVEPAQTGERFEKVNWLKAGFLFADKSVTVSPNYAKEVLSGEDKGVELNGVIAANGGLEGIVNGMDINEWDPTADKFLDVPYDADSVVAGKAAAKQTLQAEVGLPLSAEAPLFGYIGRLEEQKGVDIMLEAIPALLKAVPTAQVVVLGTGKKSFETAVAKLEELGPNAVGVVKFSEPTAHLITAGADFLMVPSRFEPCGLIQLHAMRYGTVPIVASTGGLVDTVTEDVTGFHIGPLDPDVLLESDVVACAAAFVRAAGTYNTPKYAAMSLACISQDLSWAKPAEKWEGILEELSNAARPDRGGAAADRMAAAFAAATHKKEAVITPVEAVQKGIKAVGAGGPAGAFSQGAAAAAAAYAMQAPAVVPKSVPLPVGMPVKAKPAMAPVVTKAAPKSAAGAKPASAAAPAAAAPAAAAPAAAKAPKAAAKPAAPAASNGGAAAATPTASKGTPAKAPVMAAPATAAPSKPMAAAAPKAKFVAPPMPPAATELEARRRVLKAAEDKLAARTKAPPADGKSA